MAKFKVGIYSLLNDKDCRIEEDVFRGHDIEIVNGRYGHDEDFQDMITYVDGLIIANTMIDGPVIEKMKNCRVVGRHGSGVDNFDLGKAAEKGIAICNVPMFCIDEVSDHALTFALVLARNMHLYSLHVKSGAWDIDRLPPPKKVNTMTLGLAGFGTIARLVAKKGKAIFGEIVAYDPFMDGKKAEELGVRPVATLSELAAASDVVSIHIPLSEKTFHLFDKDFFSRMKKTAFIVNTARGSLINSKDLHEALVNGTIAGAALDVMEQEPPDMNDPLFKLDNVFFTPHSAWFSDQALYQDRYVAAENVRRVLLGLEPLSRVN